MTQNKIKRAHRMPRIMRQNVEESRKSPYPTQAARGVAKEIALNNAVLSARIGTRPSTKYLGMMLAHI